MQAHDYTQQEYSGRVVNDAWRALLKSEVDRAQQLFEAGRELWSRVDPHLAVDLQMFTMGGEAVLDAIRRQRYDTWTKRPKVSKFKQLLMFLACRRAWKKANRPRPRARRPQGTTDSSE
jgi:phytoene/squalene synthetase